MRRQTSCRLRVGWVSFESAANLLGMTRTAQGSPVFAGNRMTSGGVLLSLPGQNGQVSTKDGTVCAGRCVASSSGRLARSVAMITHSLVKKFCRSSGMAVLQNLLSAEGVRHWSRESAGPAQCGSDSGFRILLIFAWVLTPADTLL